MTDRAKLEEAIKRLRDNSADLQFIATVIAAAEAHLATLPKVKMVEVWRVEYSSQSSLSGKWSPSQSLHTGEDGARRYARDLSTSDRVGCIRVTGPHLQEVPA